MTDLSPLLAVLDETSSLTLATIDPDGTPRATPLFFAVEGGPRVIFLSDPQSQHSRNLARRPQAALALYPEVTDWREIRGVQMKGWVQVVPGTERPAVLAIYRSRFVLARDLEAEVERITLYRFQPDWARLIDNRKGFGHKEEWTLA